VLREPVDARALVSTREPVFSSGGIVHVGSLCIDTRGALDWSPRLTARGALPGWQDVAGKTEAGFGPLLRRSPRETLRFPSRQAYPRMQRLQDAVRAANHEAAREAASSLVGLGHGLTPSGDDFLIGFSAALRYAEHPMADAVAQPWTQTTDVARMFHAYAARGEYSQRVHDLLATRDFASALEWGASSGADCLVGVLFASDACATSAH
jgi:hypothetical protein